MVMQIVKQSKLRTAGKRALTALKTILKCMERSLSFEEVRAIEKRKQRELHEAGMMW